MQFSEIKGQEQAIHIIERAIQTQHIAHAYLFTGPEGVGKKKAALAMAQYLNCTGKASESTQSCGSCPSCIQAQTGSQPDIIVLEPDGASIKIEQIRALLSKVSLRNYDSVYKVILINDAHLMTEQAANCLLKTLEEPTDNTVFILITSQIQNLPITILSRCQQIQFHTLSPSLIQEILLQHYPAQQSRIGLTAALAGGSMHTAEELLANDDLAQTRQDFYQLLAKLDTMRPAQIISWCEQWDKNKKMARTLLELGQLWYHDVLLTVMHSDNGLILNQDYLAELRTQHAAPEHLLHVLQYFRTAAEQLEYNASPRLVLEVVLLKTQQLISK
ncbi:MAG: DNA polymerase III subunit delta' [Peptococcaceae bacterium]|nr:DNA polymerase III subunit delta' [Peptococcaceae bacterium]